MQFIFHLIVFLGILAYYLLLNKDIHVFQMKTADIESDINRKSRRCYAGIPMDEFRNINARIVQRRRRCASISMDIFAILYVVTTQRHRGHVDIPMDIFAILYVVTTQRRRYCANIPMNTSITTNALMCNTVGVVPIFQ